MEPARKFKIIVNSKECGTCSGPTPSAVAKKVVKKLCGTSSKVVKFSLKECKRGCERVCGPYQGRMEKLDKLYKRDGKKITHRVVCGKVRKMRGGRELTVEDFEIKEGDRNFKFDRIGLRPHIFFGEEIKVNGEEIKVNGKEYYSLVVFNVEHTGGNKKTCGFKKLINNNGTIDVVEISGESIVEEQTTNNNNKKQQETTINNKNTNYENNKFKLLKILNDLLYCKKLTDFKTIRRTIYELLKNKTFNQKTLFQELDIPNNFFERDYLPVVITAEEYCVPKSFYNSLPKSINNFYKDEDMVITYSRKKKSNIFTTYVYFYIKDKILFFSSSKDNDCYNCAFYSDLTNTVYIAIFDNRNNIVNYYPIDLDLYRRTSYPLRFINLFKCLFILILAEEYRNEVENAEKMFNNQKLWIFYNNKIK